MKLNQTNGKQSGSAMGKTIKSACLGSCRKIMSRLAQAKATIFAESREMLATQEQLLRLALNEAEALALQTMYPHLIFPTLATEKVQAVVDWNARQQSMRRANPAFAPVA